MLDSGVSPPHISTSNPGSNNCERKDSTNGDSLSQARPPEHRLCPEGLAPHRNRVINVNPNDRLQQVVECRKSDGTHSTFNAFLTMRRFSRFDKEDLILVGFDCILPDVSLLFWTMENCVQRSAVSHFAVLDVHLNRPWDAGPSGCVFHRPDQRDYLWDRRGYCRLDFVRPYRRIPQQDQGKAKPDIPLAKDV
jgi:hypothetical protein